MPRLRIISTNTSLDRLLQAYAVEEARIEARRKGFACTETTLLDGSIKLQILDGASS